MSYLAAATIGVLLGILGGGGSTLTLPTLVYLMSIEPVLATGYSLFIVGFTSLVGAIDYLKQGLIDRRSVMLFGIPTVAGVLLSRAILLPAIPQTILRWGNWQVDKDTCLMVLFAVLMLTAAVSMIVNSRQKIASIEPRPLAPTTIVVWGFAVGVVTGFVGAGGGFLIVPALVFLLRLPMRQAIATSLFVIALKSLLGFLGDYRLFATMDWPLLIRFTATAIAGIVVGVRINRVMANDRLKLAFGWMLVILGIGIIIRELSLP